MNKFDCLVPETLLIRELTASSTSSRTQFKRNYSPWDAYGGGRNRGVNLPSPYFLSQFLPPPYLLFPHPGPSSSILPTPNFSFSPSSLLFPPISLSSQLFLGHFSLLRILFLPSLYALIPPSAKFIPNIIMQFKLVCFLSFLHFLSEVEFENRWFATNI